MALFRVEEELIYEEITPYIQLRVCVPVGTLINFASVPRWARWFVSPTGDWNDATAAHDCLCETNFPRFLTDAFFRHFMIACKVPLWKRVVAFYCVRLQAIWLFLAPKGKK
jgi:hypothetical protein